ncbi:MAG TPA: NmrA/HSCARG family protein [Actinoallomurus sp.]|nr:NmrA/HSCARG family protein [Actinoallomurus sp.]
MTDRQGPVLVIGATGQQGGATARQLLERGRTVHALVRDADSPAAKELQGAGAELVVGDLDDPASLRAVMEGVRGVFLVLTMMVGPRISAESVVAEERRGKAVADLAGETGIEHLVYSSLNGAEARSGIPYYESKARIESHIHALDLPATILRPVSFMDNFATYSRPVVVDGELVVSLAVRPELPMQLISVREDLRPCLRPAGAIPPDAHRAGPRLRRATGTDVHVLQRASLRTPRPPGAADGPPRPDAAGDLVAHDRLE